MRRRRRDAGFTLVELVTVITVIGIILVPMTEFLRSFFDNYPATVARLADSHDLQIATAYFSEDVANTGLRGGDPGYAPQQSVWTATTGFPPGTYCGKSAGTSILLLKWNDGSVSGSGSGGTEPVNSALYLTEGTELHRIYCQGNDVTQSDSVLAHNFVPPGPDPITCSSSCNGSIPPATITFTLNVKDTKDDQHDQTVVSTNLTGQRRQTPS